ncbi:Cys-tRNA(Pro)/Cys-tRNA(Cys) deacylase YbaK [Corynebacterium comes]|uniref:Cys-tRNA(Pro)/Cys-tRNA(Cys) deacylase n=1 Tax=Corynebacterium comes TaxID=2675218 RepID=A0A6B8VY35_9CORY|nr:Cys-tRNA(Pro)/Cys-tRNA(Cys) deacylase YbaK [Corynebacterium comes]
MRVLLDAAVPHQLHRFDPGRENFGRHAADAIDAPAELILKTLVVDTGAGLAVCCVPVPNRLSLKKAAAALGVRSVTMAEPAKARRSTGYVPGGISPLGQKTGLPTVIDADVQKQPVVYVSGGRRGLDIALSPLDLARLTSAQFSEISSG